MWRLVAEWVPKTRVSGTLNTTPWRNGFKQVLESWTRLFFIFCQLFGIFDDISKFCCTLFGKSSNLAKFWQIKKSLVQLALYQGIPIFSAESGYPKIRLQVCTRSVTNSTQRSLIKNPKKKRNSEGTHEIFMNEAT